MHPTLSKLYGPVAATLALYTALLAVYLARHHGDPATIACVGRIRAGLPPYEAVVNAVGPSGYDGQFYYALARNPWRLQTAPAIDAPAARHLRVLYPALCWVLSGGHARLLFWVMPAVNLAALGALAGLGAWVALRYGLNPWWGFVLPLAVNAGLPFLHDLTDLFSTLALFGLFAAWLRGARWWALALWAAGALLSREQNVAVALILLAVSAWRGQKSVAAGLALVVLFWLGWVGVLRSAYGVWPFLHGDGNFGVPLGGIAYRLAHLGGNEAFSRRLSIFLSLSLLHLIVQVGVACYLATRRGDAAVVICMMAGVLLAVVGGEYIYGDFWSYTRVFAWLPLGIWFCSLEARLRWPLVLLSPALLWTFAAALRYV